MSIRCKILAPDRGSPHYWRSKLRSNPQRRSPPLRGCAHRISHRSVVTVGAESLRNQTALASWQDDGIGRELNGAPAAQRARFRFENGLSATFHSRHRAERRWHAMQNLDSRDRLLENQPLARDCENPNHRKVPLSRDGFLDSH
jgi:hypothetical protein